MPSPLFPGSPAPAEREDPESQLLQAVIERHPERSLELVQRLVHRRGLAALGTFQQITLPRLVDDEARCWLDTLLMQVPEGFAAGRGLESGMTPADQGVTSAAQEDPQHHGQRASSAVDAAIAAMVAEFPELAPAGSPLDHAVLQPPLQSVVQPVVQPPSSAGTPEPDPFADSLMTAIPEPLAAGSLAWREPLLPSPPHDQQELASSSPRRFGAATNLAGRLRRRLGGLRNQVISPLTHLLAFSPESPGSDLPLSSSLSSSSSLHADPVPAQEEPAPSPSPWPEQAGSGLRTARGSLAKQTPATAWEHAASEPAPVPAALADLRAWLPDPTPHPIR